MDAAIISFVALVVLVVIAVFIHAFCVRVKQRRNKERDQKAREEQRTVEDQKRMEGREMTPVSARRRQIEVVHEEEEEESEQEQKTKQNITVDQLQGFKLPSQHMIETNPNFKLPFYIDIMNKPNTANSELIRPNQLKISERDDKSPDAFPLE
jgi:hypothetical protein